jgi:hypothetical protein
LNYSHSPISYQIIQKVFVSSLEKRQEGRYRQKNEGEFEVPGVFVKKGLEGFHQNSSRWAGVGAQTAPPALLSIK